MPILISYLPWIAFLATPGLLGPAGAALLGLALSGGVLVRDARRGGPKLMDAKGAAFFALFLAAALTFPAEDVERWAAPAGTTALFAFALVTVLIGRPFTLPYAREMTDPAVHETAIFRRAVTVTALGWVAGFLVMAAGAWAEFAAPQAAAGMALWTTFAGIGGAIIFQTLYRRSLPAS